jgi:hypothetical protein
VALIVVGSSPTEHPEMCLKLKIRLILFKIIHFFLLEGKKQTVEKFLQSFFLIIKKDSVVQRPLLFLLVKFFGAVTVVRLKKIFSKKFFSIIPKRLKKTSQLNFFLLNFLLRKKGSLIFVFFQQITNTTNIKKLSANIYRFSLKNKINLNKR